MPVILPNDKEDFWFDPANEDKDLLTSLLAPYPSDKMELYPVTPRVNWPAFDKPENIRPI